MFNNFVILNTSRKKKTTNYLSSILFIFYLLLTLTKKITTNYLTNDLFSLIGR